MSWPTDEEFDAIFTEDEEDALDIAELRRRIDAAKGAVRVSFDEALRMFGLTREDLIETPSPCRSGCKTQDHDSYAECLKAAAVQIGNLK